MSRLMGTGEPIETGKRGVPVAWFVRDIWQADDETEWAEQLTGVIDELEQSGPELVSVAAHPQPAVPSAGPEPATCCFAG
jgi:hypothetical protein